MGSIKTVYCGNGYEREVTYALVGVNEDGEIVNEERFKAFWHNLRIALEKRDKEYSNDV